MTTITVDSDSLLILAGVRIVMGVAFVAVAAQLIAIRYTLNSKLLFRRSVLIFAMFIGVCGLARLASGVELMHFVTMGHTLGKNVYEIIPAALDTLSALCGIAAAVAMVPLTLNAMGWHIYMDKL